MTSETQPNWWPYTTQAEKDLYISLGDDRDAATAERELIRNRAKQRKRNGKAPIVGIDWMDKK